MFFWSKTDIKEDTCMSNKLKLIGLFSMLIIVAACGEDDSKLSEAIESTKEETSKAVDALKKDSETATAEVSGVVTPSASPEEPSLVEQAKETASELKDDAVELSQKVGEKVSETVDKTVETVKEVLPGEEPNREPSVEASVEPIETDKAATETEIKGMAK